MKSFVNKTLFLIIAAVVGLLFSSYLLVTHYQTPSTESIFFRVCAVSDYLNCHKVNGSGYSTLFGFPVAALGMLYYCFILLTVIFRSRVKDRSLAESMTAAALGASALSVILIIPLFCISFFLIKAMCPFCIVTWVCNIAIFALVIAIVKEGGAIFAAFKGIVPAIRRSYRAPSFIGYLAGCAGVFAVLLVVNICFATDEQERMAAKIRELSDQAYKAYLTAPKRNIDISTMVPYLGNPNASVTIVEYMNFNCGACRKSYPVIHELAQKYGDSIAVYLKNYPIDGMCNPHVKKKGNGFSCMASLISIGLRGKPGYAGLVNAIMRSPDMLKPQLIYDSVRAANISDPEADAMMKSDTVRRALLAEIEEADSLGISGTPTFIVNGKVLKSGALPLELLERIITAELQESR